MKQKQKLTIKSTSEDEPFSSTYRLNNIEFKYLKRKEKKLRRSGSPSSMQYQPKQNSTSTSIPHTLNIQYLSELSSDAAFQQTPVKNRLQYKQFVPFSCQSAQQIDYIGSCFPKRRKKTNEYQLFKMLSKYSEIKKTNRFLTQQTALIEQRSLRSCETRSSVKPHLKTKPKLNWNKNLYCVNRDRQGGILPLSLKPNKEIHSEKMKNIKVANPFSKAC